MNQAGVLTALRSVRAAPLLFALYAGTACLAIVARYDFDSTALIRFGHRYIEQNQDLTPASAIRFRGNEANGGNGYDGQIFYYYASTMWKKGQWPVGFSNAYRAPRAGYPFLASLFSWMGNRGTAYGMILVQILSIVGGLICFWHLLPDERRSWTLLLAVSPFVLQSFAFLVSDAVMISLAIIGIYFSRRNSVAASLLAWIFFSLAVMTKESSLFILFPYGLWALLRKDWKLCVVVAGSLVPMVCWQVYLFRAHGMVPASILSTFLSPLLGIRGVASQTTDLLRMKPFPIVEIFKVSAKWLLILLLPVSAWTALGGFKLADLQKTGTPFRLAALFVVLSICIADFQYFWGIFENVGRMFTALVPAVILARSETKTDTSWKTFVLILCTLSFLVWARICFLSPVFPFDHYVPYSGPIYPAPSL